MHVLPEVTDVSVATHLWPTRATFYPHPFIIDLQLKDSMYIIIEICGYQHNVREKKCKGLSDQEELEKSIKYHVNCDLFWGAELW